MTALLWIASLAGLLGLYWGYRVAQRYAGMAAAYAAKTVCSGLFIAGRPLDSLHAEELGLDQPRVLGLCRLGVDREQQSVRASFPGLVSRTAVYREGLGSALAMETPLAALRAQAQPHPPLSHDWPAGPINPGALAHAFEEANPAQPHRSRAAVVLHRGELVAERYAAGFDADTPQLGWSLTKTAFGALIGAAVQQGYLSLDQQALLPEWHGDERSQISLRQLLQMRGGLAWAEDYDRSDSEVMQMLFATGHTARYAVSRPLAHPPGSHWQYASGTSNVLSRVLQQALGERYPSWPHTALFAPLNLASAVFEADADGLFTASSYMYASARDWARIGQLLLQDGVWNGERLLPEGWMAFCTTPAPGSGDEYGAHLWLDLGEAFEPPGSPPTPDDAFHAVGHEGQFISVLPAQELVIVRLGLMRHPGSWNQAMFIDRVRRGLEAG